MRFFYLTRELDVFIPTIFCFYEDAANHISFIERLNRNSQANTRIQYLEIPSSCVRRIYGKTWPATGLRNYMQWLRVWPSKGLK